MSREQECSECMNTMHANDILSAVELLQGMKAIHLLSTNFSWPERSGGHV